MSMYTHGPANQPIFLFAISAGSQASPTVIAPATVLGETIWAGYDGSAYSGGAAQIVTSIGTWGASNHATKTTFQNIALGSTSINASMVLGNHGSSRTYNISFLDYVLSDGSVWGWSHDDTTDPNTGLSRLAAASVALGNGTQGDVTGKLTLGNEVLTAAAPTVAASQVGLGGTTAATATAGGGQAVPATILGYLVANVAGTTVKIPYFSA